LEAEAPLRTEAPATSLAGVAAAATSPAGTVDGGSGGGVGRQWSRPAATSVAAAAATTLGDTVAGGRGSGVGQW